MFPVYYQFEGLEMHTIKHLPLLLRIKYFLLHIKYRFIPQILWRRQKIWVSILFDAEKVSWTDLRQIEDILHKNGIAFDHNLGNKHIEWCLDFSLNGPVKIEFIKKADE